MEIIDNFLSEEEFETFLETILHWNFPWYRGIKVTDNIVSPIKEFQPNGEQTQLCHVFINDSSRSDKLPSMYPIFNKLEVKEIFRAKINLTFNNGKQVVGGWHNDFALINKNKIAIFYINDNNGFTLLEDGTKILSKANRLVIFNNEILHTSVSQTDTEERMVLNIGYT